MTDGTDVAEPGTDVVPADVDSGALVPAGANTRSRPRSTRIPDRVEYVLIAVVLVILTAFEVAASYPDINSNLLIAVLAIMAAAKFLLVVRVVHAHEAGLAVLPAPVHGRHRRRHDRVRDRAARVLQHRAEVVAAVLADAAFPAWAPHPDVWLLIAGLAAAYAVAVRRLGPRLAPTGTRVVTRSRSRRSRRAARVVDRLRLADP